MINYEKEIRIEDRQVGEVLAAPQSTGRIIFKIFAHLLMEENNTRLPLNNGVHYFIQRRLVVHVFVMLLH